jgi:hypothetical protein
MRRVFGLLALATLFVLCGLGEAQAQSIDDKCSSLLERTMDGSVVRVRESISVGEAVDDIESKNRRKEIEGYRIVIFSDNGQYAGDNAREVLEKFQENHPHINAYMVYESPYFKVSVGDCLTLEEASHLMAQLDDEYPELFPKREVIKYEDLANTRAEKREVVDSLQNE